MENNTVQQNIPSGWKQATLATVSDIVMGQSPDSSSYNKAGEGLPFFQGKADFTDTYKTIIRQWTTEPTKISEPADTLISVRAPVGDVAVNNVRACIGRGLAAMRAKQQVTDQVYLFYILQSLKTFFNTKAQGSTFTAINGPELRKISILLPPIKEQQKIAEILGTVDEDIAKTQEVIDTTEKLKRGLMQQLFTRGIGHTKFKETKIGQIPEGWEIQKLEKFIKSLDAGVSVNSRDVQKGNGEIGILKTSAVTFGIFDPNQHKTVVSEELAKVAVPIKAERLIVSRMNTRDLVGANAYTDKSLPDLFLPDRLWQVEPNDETKISMRWLSYIFNLQWKNGVFASLATGTSASMKNLSKGSILNMELAFPKIKEQKEIAEILSAVDEKISVNKKLKEKLTLLKKGLMQDLLSGSKRVNI